MSEKTPTSSNSEPRYDALNAHYDRVYGPVATPEQLTQELPSRDNLIDSFVSKRSTYQEELEQLEAVPGFRRVYEDNAEIAGVKDDIEGVNKEWNFYGGDAIDAAQAKVDALGFKSTANERIAAQAELRDAKNAFYNNFKQTYEETNATDDAEATSADNVEASSTEAANEVQDDNVEKKEVAAEGERLTDYLRSIRKAQHDNDYMLEKVLLQAYKEVLESKGNSEDWVQRHMDIAKTPLESSEAQSTSTDAEPSASVDKYRAQFRESVNTVLDTEDAPEVAPVAAPESVPTDMRDVVDAAISNIDQSERAAVVAESAPAQAETASEHADAEVNETTSEEEEDEPQRAGRVRTFGKSITKMFVRPKSSNRARAKRVFEHKVTNRAEELLAERQAQYEAGEGEYADIQPGEYRALKDARRELKNKRKNAPLGENQVAGFKSKFRDEYRNTRNKQSARNERSTAETTAIPVTSSSESVPVEVSGR